MYARFELVENDPLMLLDEEFDNFEVEPAGLEDHTNVQPALLADELAWDDQLDNGDEMSI